MSGSTRQGGTDVADDGDSFDYVVVGAGAAGSVLCNRLTEDPGTTVCVLE